MSIFRFALKDKYHASRQLKVSMKVANLLVIRYLGNFANNFKTMSFQHYPEFEL